MNPTLELKLLILHWKISYINNQNRSNSESKWINNNQTAVVPINYCTFI